jgi:hypothetical protein
MDFDPKFEGMRPYIDSEIPSAMKRIADSEAFPAMASFTFPDKSISESRELLLGIRTCDEFQFKVMWHVNDQIEKRSIRHLTYSGLERLEKGRPYLFISNHRDIMLDASLLQNILHDNGFATTEITFGANLMSPGLLVDIGRANKMFRVERPGKLTMRDFYGKSLLLSEYIRDAVTVRGQSVWIAQRNGRTKDGNDMTDPAVMKMLSLSGPLGDLNIVPMSISYEWETCDYAKALELLVSRKTKYVKKPGEDLRSIISGITSWKGDIHIGLSAPIGRSELESACSGASGSSRYKAAAALLDDRIHGEYRLTKNNFIAHDILHSSSEFRGSNYSGPDEEAFREHAEKLRDFETDDPEALMDIFLGIYSNPVDNCFRHGR